MEQEPQEQNERKNFNSRGFCYAQIGREERFDVSLGEDVNWLGPAKQLGTLEFTGSRQTSAVVHLEHWKAEIEFDNISEFRDLRGRCLRLSSGALPLCRLSRPKGSANESREAKIEIIFASEQRHLSSKIHFLVNDNVNPPENWIGTRHEFNKNLIKSISFKTGKGHIILLQFDGLLGKEMMTGEGLIELLNSNGDRVICQIYKETSRGWIEVVNYQPRTSVKSEMGEKQQYWKAGNVRIFSFDENPEYDPEHVGGELQPLEALMSKNSTFFGIWRRYRELLSSMNSERFESRKDITLTFRAGIPDTDDPSCHRVNIANWDMAKMNWSEVKDVPVYIAQDGSQLSDQEKRSKAVLIEVGAMGDARIRWTENTPIDHGVIMVREESSLNDERIKNAIYTLEKGLSAYPQLSSLLNDPSIAEAPRKISPKLRGSIPYDDSQKDAIFKALGNRSIVAIQGPPGTGKTQVIVGIIKELHRASRKASGAENTAPFRVLISSAQNVAVFNAIDLLANEGILIDQRLSRRALEQPENANRITNSYERASQIAKLIDIRIEKNPELKFYATQARAVETMIRELEIVKISDTVADSLLSTLEFTEPYYRLLPDELSGLIDATKNQLMDYTFPKLQGSTSNAPIDGILQALDSWVCIDEGKEYLPNVTALEVDFDQHGLCFEYEQIAEIERSHRRAKRDGDEQKANDLRIAFKYQSASIREKFVNVGMDSFIEESDVKEQTVKRMIDVIIERIMGYHATLANNKGGVLTQWRMSLDEQPGLWKKLVEKYSEIRGATCQMAAPEVRRERLGVADASYDLVVLDEAARTDPGEILIPLTLGKTLLLVGDQKQLPPYIDDLAAEKLQMHDASGLELLKEQSFFQEVFDALPDSNKIMLNRQYRCHPVIGQAISQAFYDGKLHSGPALPLDNAKWVAKKKPIWNLFENHPLCWVDTDILPTHGSCNNLNTHESDLALEIICRTIPTLYGSEKQIGVITFYREQLNHLNAKLESAIPNHTRILEANTVDSFQGKEFPLVILLTSRLDVGAGRVGFLNLANRVNVAVSRAQCQLVIIGSRQTLLHQENGSHPFKAFRKSAGANLKFAGPDLKLINS